MHDIPIEPLLLILTSGLMAGYLCRQVSLPPLLGYLLLGATLGEGLLGWISEDAEQVEHLAELGVFFLLFSIGLELSLEELRRMRWHLILGGGTQMTFIALPTAFVLQKFGWTLTSAILIALAVSFSSTVLVFKSLGELGKTSTNVGRRTLAILLFQDAALVPLLLCLPILAGSNEAASIGDWVRLIAATTAFLVVTVGLRFVMNGWVIPRIAKHRSPDLVVLMTLTTLGGITLFAHRIGLPPALGAFAAGLAFGGNRWSEQVDSLILPFREAFSAIFFVSLGLLFDPLEIVHNPMAVLGGIVLLIALKSIAAFLALVATGLPWQQSWRPSVGLAHVGEFAFVIMLLGASSGVISPEQQRLLATISGATLLASPFLIRWGFKSWETGSTDEPDESQELNFEGVDRRCVVIGMGPVGRAVVGRLEVVGYAVHAVDTNPLNLQAFAQLGFPTVAGDGRQEEVLKAAGIENARIVVVCVPIDEVAIAITRQTRELNPNAEVVVRCRYARSIALLRAAGANKVISEEARTTRELVTIVEQLSDAASNESAS